MNLSLKDLKTNFHTASPATSDEIAKLEAHFGFAFPGDFKEFLTVSNGLEGDVNDGYLVLWSAGEMIELNEAYKVKEFVADIIIFGSDGAEEAFAFDISGAQTRIIKLPFIGMGHIPAEKLADTFEAFLIPRVKQQKGFFKRIFG